MSDDDLHDLNKKIDQFRKSEKESVRPVASDTESRNMHIGMRAGSIFISHVLAGGLLGFGVDTLFQTKPLFIIVLFLAGFGTGLYRCQKIMSEKA
jgi:ATP synthase protein I